MAEEIGANLVRQGSFAVLRREDESAFGIRNNGSSPLIEDSTINVSGGANAYGIVDTSFSGATRSVKTLSNAPKIGLTQLSGAFEPSGIPSCAGVYTSNLTFFPGPNCP